MAAPSLTGPPLLAVTDLHVAYRGLVALRGVSLEVPAGAFVGVLGPNGAGKTSLVRAIGGSLRFYSGSVTGGSIELCGVASTRATASQLARSGVAVVPEGRALFAHLTVEENLRSGAVGGRRSQLPLDRVYELFPRLRERRRLQAGWLSGGEQQQLAVGRALMSSPSLLVLDEPSLGLAPIMVQAIMEELVRINTADAVTMVLVEQNAALALPYVSYAYVLDNGAIRTAGPAADLRADASVVESYLASRSGQEGGTP